MPELRGITVSVNYGPLLHVTLVLNMRHMTECLVITTPEDRETQEVARGVSGVRLHVTDAFTRHGAIFNKGLALEEGFDVLGRNGWILIWDSDCVFPPELPIGQLDPTKLYGCLRRVLEDPARWSPDLDWRTCATARDGGAIGFFQLAHADAPSLAGKRPWYDVSFTHAGGGDAYFMEHFDPAHRTVLQFEVLHLGPTSTHWFGTDQASKDMMARFVRENGWYTAMRKHSSESAARAPEIVERVEVPGYPASTYDLPFVRRAKKMRDQKP
jgi:hypothetical protein